MRASSTRELCMKWMAGSVCSAVSLQLRTKAKYSRCEGVGWEGA